MKVDNLALVGLIPVLASAALARPRAKVADDPEPISQTSRVTAFVNTDEGLKVQCWEINDLLPSLAPTSRHCDSKRTPRMTQMRVGDGGIDGIDILTWPSPTTIWPPPSNYASTAVDFTAKPNLFTVKDGLIYIEARPATAQSNVDDAWEQHVFADVNGDDWFYFEDSTSSAYRAKTAESPLKVATVSGSDTTLVRFRYESTPHHRVLHEGRCNFAGLKPAAEGAADKDLDQAPLTVQEL